jgi:GxGYxYP putative glycoside hydrolase C-terminal domain/GxGYxYP third domain/GxGYxYP_N second domain/GxGYxYP_N 1st domain
VTGNHSARPLAWLLILMSMAALPVRAADESPTPASALFPRNSPPAQSLHVLDVSKEEQGVKLAMSALQGIVNRSQPRIYLLRRVDADRFWLEAMRTYGDTGPEKVVESPRAMLELYRSEIKGAVVYDPDFPASINIATMVAGVRDLVTCTAELADDWDLPIVEDLRDRWSTNADAYRWAYQTLWPEQDHTVLCCLAPHAADYMMRDYLISHRIFTFWITGKADASSPGARPNAEKMLFEALFAKMDDNMPVLGFWHAQVGKDIIGMGEYHGVKWAGEFGKFTVVCDWAANLSVHSGVQVDASRFRQSRPAPKELDSKTVYLCLTGIESGDCPSYWLHRQRTLWQDPKRGRVPMNWSVAPATIDLMPGVLRWYYDRATPNDFFLCSISGVGYVYPFEGYGARTIDPGATFAAYIDLTRRHMARLDLTITGIYSHPFSDYQFGADDAVLNRYVEGIPELDAILCGMGRDNNITPANANGFLKRDVPVMHCLTRWSRDPKCVTRDQKIAWLADSIRAQTPKARPGFLHAMAYSWHYDPGMLAEVVASLGPGYTAVRADDFADLYRRSQGK